MKIEESEVGREVLRQLIQNAEVAREQRIPFCQDTGYAVLFIELGKEVNIIGGSLKDALNDGMSRGYQEGFLRKSMVRNPVERINTDDNMPAVINTDPADQVFFYVGPTPAPSSKVIGSAGPPTADRMDAFTPLLIERGLRAMIGKGRRSNEVREAILKYGCAYFGSIEGTAALLAGCIRSVEIVTYEDLGPKAIYRLTVKHFPTIVVNDLHGGDLYEDGRIRYRRSWP